MMSLPFSSRPTLSISSTFARYGPCRRSFCSTSPVCNYYKTLGVPHNATKAQIKSNFYRLSKEHHPDVARTSDSKDLFHAVSEAYSILNDDRQRRAYDRKLEAEGAAANQRSSAPSPRPRPSKGFTYSEWGEKRRRTVHYAWEFSSSSGNSQHRRPGWTHPRSHTGAHHAESAPFPSQRHAGQQKHSEQDIARDRVDSESPGVRAIQVLMIMFLASAVYDAFDRRISALRTHPRSAAAEPTTRNGDHTKSTDNIILS